MLTLVGNNGSGNQAGSRLPSHNAEGEGWRLVDSPRKGWVSLSRAGEVG